MDQNCLLLNHWWRLLISGGVFESAGDNYWSAMWFNNLRCSLLIHSVIYQSAGVNTSTINELLLMHTVYNMYYEYWNKWMNEWITDPREKLKCSKQTLNDPKQKCFFCSFIQVQWPNFLWKKCPTSQSLQSTSWFMCILLSKTQKKW